ncbi:MAG: hypothetical protein J6R77_07730 [Clostridia bacterium]|nr:hypothetical protein [Clostridia bacterium]
MKQVDAAVRRETWYIAAWVAVMSVLMQAVFLIIGRWDYTVLLGNLLGGGAAVGNFFLLGLTVQKAVGQDPAEVALRVRRSQSLRMLGLFLVALIGWLLPCFSIWTSVIPFLFPRVAIAFWPLFNKEKTE